MATDWTTQHLTGANVRRTLAVASSATPSFNADVYTGLNITALAAAASFSFTGTPDSLEEVVFRIKDNGVARALTFPGAQFEAVGAAFPATTTAGKRHTLTFVYDPATAKLGLVSAVVEA